MISVQQVLYSQIDETASEVQTLVQQSYDIADAIFSSSQPQNVFERALYGVKAFYEVVKQKILTSEYLWDSCIQKGFVSGGEDLGQRLQQSKQAIDAAYKNIYVANKHFTGELRGI